jgi:hypothetical protein
LCDLLGTVFFQKLQDNNLLLFLCQLSDGLLEALGRHHPLCGLLWPGFLSLCHKWLIELLAFDGQGLTPRAMVVYHQVVRYAE